MSSIKAVHYLFQHLDQFLTIRKLSEAEVSLEHILAALSSEAPPLPSRQRQVGSIENRSHSLGAARKESESASFCYLQVLPTKITNMGVVFLDDHNCTVLYSRSKASAYNVLHTFEDSAEKVFALYRFVRNLDALKDQPNELIHMLSSLTKSLGTRRKAWAVVILSLAERKLGRYTISRQAERLIRRVLKDEDDVVLQEVILTWSVSIDSLMNPLLRSLSEGDMPAPAFLRLQADKH